MILLFLSSPCGWLLFGFLWKITNNNPLARLLFRFFPSRRPERSPTRVLRAISAFRKTGPQKLISPDRNIFKKAQWTEFHELWPKSDQHPTKNPVDPVVGFSPTSYYWEGALNTSSTTRSFITAPAGVQILPGVHPVLPGCGPMLMWCTPAYNR